MARALGLEAGDAGLVAVGEDGFVHGPSPALAVVEPDGVRFGTEAVAASRLLPRQVVSDFWARLDEQPRGHPFPPGLRAADLVHGHLLCGGARA